MKGLISEKDFLKVEKEIKRELAEIGKTAADVKFDKWVTAARMFADALGGVSGRMGEIAHQALNIAETWREASKLAKDDYAGRLAAWSGLGYYGRARRLWRVVRLVFPRKKHESFQDLRNSYLVNERLSASPASRGATQLRVAAALPVLSN